MEGIMFDWQDPSTWAVLVVDDEPDNLEVVAETLEFYGASVKTAKDGIDGLAVLQEFKPNLILLDLSMPKMNGWETRTRIKADTKTALIPVVALTAHAMPGDLERALAAGFNGYLIKPITVVSLINDIRATIASQSAATTPIAPDQPAAVNPVVSAPPAAVNPIAPVQPAATNPVVSAPPAAVNPIAPAQPAAANPVVSAPPAAVNPIAPAQPAAASPVVPAPPAAANPIVPAQPAAANPVVSAPPAAANPIVPAQPAAASPVVSAPSAAANPIVPAQPAAANPAGPEQLPIGNKEATSKETPKS
jgi:CheY-like chemotaxis protein